MAFDFLLWGQAQAPSRPRLRQQEPCGYRAVLTP